MADYIPDVKSGARTVHIVFGPRRGLLLTIALGYALLPLMSRVGVMFKLPMIFYVILFGLAAFVSLRLWLSRRILGSRDISRLLGLGKVLGRTSSSY